jgi:lysophospholipase
MLGQSGFPLALFGYMRLIGVQSGTSPVHTNLRVNAVLSTSHQKFPPIPATSDDFVSMGLNLRPTLFGCDPTSTSDPEYPLVLYLPNAPPLTEAKPVTKYVRLQTFQRIPFLINFD